MNFKYRFECLLQHNKLKEVSDFLKKCDINTGEICHKEVFEMTCWKESPVYKIKETLTHALTALDYNVIDIKGGKIE